MSPIELILKGDQPNSWWTGSQNYWITVYCLTNYRPSSTYDHNYLKISAAISETFVKGVLPHFTILRATVVK